MFLSKFQRSTFYYGSAPREFFIDVSRDYNPLCKYGPEINCAIAQESPKFVKQL